MVAVTGASGGVGRPVVEHYDTCQRLNLSAAEKGDLVQYLRSR